MYLADPDLLLALQNYINAKEAYSNMVGNRSPQSFDNTAEGQRRKQWIETTREALRIETERRYRNLRNEIDQLEHISVWKFWKW